MEVALAVMGIAMAAVAIIISGIIFKRTTEVMRKRIDELEKKLKEEKE